MAFWPIGMAGGGNLELQRDTSTAAFTVGDNAMIVSCSGANTLTAWTTVNASTSLPCYGIYFGFLLQLSTEVLCDLGIRTGAGAERMIMENIPGSSLGSSGGPIYKFPVYVPPGVTVLARFRARTANTILVGGITQDVFSLQHEGVCSHFYGIGVDTADSGGTAIVAAVTASASTDINGVAWTEITASTSTPIFKMWAVIGNNADNVRANSHLWLEIGHGTAGNERVLLSGLRCRAEAAGDIYVPDKFGPFPVNIPEGTRLTARAMGITGADTFDIILVAGY